MRTAPAPRPAVPPSSAAGAGSAGRKETATPPPPATAATATPRSGRSSPSIGLMVHQHADGRDDDEQVAPDRPLGDIFQVRLEPVDQILMMVENGRAHG